MVSEVSAIDVASTTLRRPLGAGAMARSCTAASSAPNSGTMSMAGIVDPLGEQSLRAADFGRARQKRQHRACIGAQRCRDRVRHLPLERRIRLAAEIARLDREGAAFALDHRRIAEQFATRAPSSVADITRMRKSSRRPCLRVARQREPEIGIERALMKFVEQHRGDAVQFGIVEDLPRENAFGDDLDARRARDLRAETHAIADGLADVLAQRLRHAFGAGARRDPARLQHDDLLACAQGSSSSASGTRVVLPAPGGATSTAAFVRSVRASSPSTASIGSGVSNYEALPHLALPLPKERAL